MPIFRKKNSKKGKNGENIPDPPKLTSQSSITDTTNAVQEVDVMDKPKSENQQILRRENSTKSNFEFKCQQAQGSPTKLIAGFSSIKELYVKIAQAYNFPPDEVLYCTLNTHKVDMNHLLGARIGLDDFIFVHRKGQPKEIEITKAEDSLGLTITGNNAGYCFIKKIREGSLIQQLGYIHVGDHIEKIDDVSVVGKRHVDVAKILQAIPTGTIFKMRLVEPLKAGFSIIGPKQAAPIKKPDLGSGRKTIKLWSTGPATVEEAPDDAVQAAVEKINNLFDLYLGVNDVDIATLLWDIGSEVHNPIDMTDQIQENYELSQYDFSDEFIFECWGIISDAKAGRLSGK